MTVADRIKHLREQMGMTQEELAKRMGYTGKSSISKIETSGNNVTIKKIARLAPILNTSNAYLMGWTDNPDPNISPIETGFIMHENLQKDMHNKLEVDIENSDFLSSLDSDEKEEIIHLYQLYKNADPKIQSVIDTLLRDQ